VLIQTIEKKIPSPKRDPAKPVRMHIARSFDVNKPGTLPEELVGGILGGSIMQGVLRVGDEVEITPGVRVEKAGKVFYQNLETEVASLKAGGFETEEARPGGLVGVGTNLDPSLTKGDALVGSLLGSPGTLPEVWNDLSFEYHLLERVVGAKEGTKIESLKPKENILVSVGTATSLGIVDTASKDQVHMNLKRPISAEKGSRAAFGRQFSGRWRLIGYGIIT
jgi:translation initiation factor 2 subunit 3